MKLKVAGLDDIDAVLALHCKYQINTIDENDKKDGFITTAFTKEQLTNLIANERGLFIAVKDGKVIAYAMAASWGFWSAWPMFAHMIKNLPELEYAGRILSTENSYQYGPVCIEKEMRGKDVFIQIFKFALVEMSARYPVLITFINKMNPRSYAAHVHKAGLEVIQEFEYNGNHYYELACVTAHA